MAKNLSQEQRECLASIDAILTILDSAPQNEINFGGAINPFDFLFEIIFKKIPFNKMVNWLANIITYVIPEMELAVKAVLLAKLKERIDCNSDPRIPEWIRESLSSTISENDKQTKGLMFSVEEIDFMNMFYTSPMSPMGSYFYFGTKFCFSIDSEEERYLSYKEAEEACYKKNLSLDKIKDRSDIRNVYELARARDFNAFLWFAIKKGFFPKSELSTQLKEINIFEYQERTSQNGIVRPGEIISSGNNNLLCINLNKQIKTENTGRTSNDLVKSSFAMTLGDKNYTYKYKLVPTAFNNNSVNWYVNRGSYFNFLKPKKYRKPRDYSQEFAICNIMYMDNIYGNVADRKYKINQGIRFTVLPKPLVHIPKLGEPIWGFKKILFNSKGVQDSKGKLSVRVNSEIPDYDKNHDEYVYKCANNNELRVSKLGDYWLQKTGGGTADNLNSILYECYPNLTVYEFNYDFVMGMQLFDPVTISSRLIATISNIRSLSVGANLKISKTETLYQMRIAEVVKKIVNANAYQVSDCFFTFDNAKYDAMITESELKRSQLYPFNKNGKVEARDGSNQEDNIIKILDEFDNEGNLEKNTEVITRAFTQATANITQEVLPEDKYEIQFNIIKDIIKSLTNIAVEVLVTPKMVLLFNVNIALLGERNKDNYKKTFDDFLHSITDIIVALVLEIKDLILQKLLSLARKILEDLFEGIKSILLDEQLYYYRRLMEALLKACNFKLNRGTNLDSKLDVVDYADIDKIEDRPLENNC